MYEAKSETLLIVSDDMREYPEDLIVFTEASVQSFQSLMTVRRGGKLLKHSFHFSQHSRYIAQRL